jgi:hypothetical protein
MGLCDVNSQNCAIGMNWFPQKVKEVPLALGSRWGSATLVVPVNSQNCAIGMNWFSRCARLPLATVTCLAARISYFAVVAILVALISTIPLRVGTLPYFPESRHSQNSVSPSPRAGQNIR